MVVWMTRENVKQLLCDIHMIKIAKDRGNTLYVLEVALKPV